MSPRAVPQRSTGPHPTLCLCGHPYARHVDAWTKSDGITACLVRKCPCDSYRPAPSEAAFQSTVCEHLRLHGFRVFSVRKSSVISAASGRRVSMVTDTGWPDVLALKGPRVAAWEFKAVNGKTTPEQDEWLLAWKQAGADARVVRPGDFDEIQKWIELREVSG